MEGRLGHDFGEVRVHTDRRAAASARDLHALAYTVGQDVVFGAGRYAPATPEGRRLLAHELVHVVQQGGRPPAPRASLSVGPAQDPAETEAERVADRVVAGAAIGPSIGSYGVALRRQAAPAGADSGAQQVPAAPSGVTQQHPGCDRRTTRVGDPAAIIEEAKATAITWINSVIPMVDAAITAPGSWRGTIASELLDRHFHCPSVEQLDYIRTTMQLIAALLPRLQLHCDTAFNRLCVGDNVWGSMDDDPFTPILCPGYFRVSENRRARVLIQIQAWLLGRVKECFPRDPCYDDFSLPASNMVANRTSYGYFTAEAVGAENHPRPLNIPCPSRQPPEPSQPEPEPTRACYEAGRLTGRIVVFPDPPARPHVQVGSGSATGRLLDERSDASGYFVCDRGRRVGQVW